uniref:Uncharacterized protein n=1 Tax=Oryza brachyantha TaxID=4533 RepID=J3MHT9_ORYBR
MGLEKLWLQYCAFVPCGGTGTSTNSSTSISDNNILKFSFRAPLLSNRSSSASSSINATINSGKNINVSAREIPAVGRKYKAASGGAEERRLPAVQDVRSGKQYLLTMAVGYTQKLHIYTRSLLMEWFLHPSIAAKAYIFVWDEDLGVDDVHRHREEARPADLAAGARQHQGEILLPGHLAGDIHTSKFVENDLVHGWGLDSNFWRCVHEPEQHIGVVDAQFVVHRGVPTLITQGDGEQDGSSAKVRSRQFDEMHTFDRRIANADKAQAIATAADHHR